MILTSIFSPAASCRRPWGASTPQTVFQKTEQLTGNLLWLRLLNSGLPQGVSKRWDFSWNCPQHFATDLWFDFLIRVLEWEKQGIFIWDVKTMCLSILTASKTTATSAPARFIIFILTSKNISKWNIVKAFHFESELLYKVTRHNFRTFWVLIKIWWQSCNLSVTATINLSAA